MTFVWKLCWAWSPVSLGLPGRFLPWNLFASRTAGAWLPPSVSAEWHYHVSRWFYSILQSQGSVSSELNWWSSERISITLSRTVVNEHIPHNCHALFINLGIVVIIIMNIGGLLLDIWVIKQFDLNNYRSAGHLQMNICKYYKEYHWNSVQLNYNSNRSLFRVAHVYIIYHLRKRYLVSKLLFRQVEN